MPATSHLLELLRFGGPRLPLLIVYLVGIILALTTWGRHPTASLLSLLAFVIFVLGSLLAIRSDWPVYVQHSAADPDWSDRTLWMNVTSYLGTGMNVMGWIMLLIALFARRPQAPELWARPAPGRGGRDFPERGVPPGPSSPDIRR
jgi:hypothetical protein